MAEPLFADHYLADLIHAHFLLGDYEEAIRTAKRMRRRKNALRTLAASLALCSDSTDAARQTVAELRKIGPAPNISADEWVTMVPDRDPSTRRASLRA